MTSMKDTYGIFKNSMPYYGVVGEDDIRNLQHYCNVSLPNDYLDFLRELNGCTFCNDVYLNIENKCVLIQVLISIGTSSDEGLRLAYDTVREMGYPEFFPIAHTTYEGRICLANTNRGHGVYYLEPKNISEPLSNIQITKIADGFSEFLKLLVDPGSSAT